MTLGIINKNTFYSNPQGYLILPIILIAIFVFSFFAINTANAKAMNILADSNEDHINIPSIANENIISLANIKTHGDSAIATTSLQEGDWLYIDGDEKRGWFVDKSTIYRPSKNEISYWQLIVYNSSGRRLFADLMDSEDMSSVGYTLQWRHLNIKDNTMSTYYIEAYDISGNLIMATELEGKRTKIEPDTMAYSEAATLKKILRNLPKVNIR